MRVSKIYEEPRTLIKANPNAEFVELPFNREDAHCCGSVLTLISDPEAAARIGNDKHEEARSVGATKLLAACPCCEFQLRVQAEKNDSDVEVVDLARFSAEALGFELPDPNPAVAEQWAVFDAMIKLMTPQGFADLMKSMWPELIDAMPVNMGGMMKGMAKMPGAMEAMKPMFPALFPKLLPQMMPKVMPTMIERIKAKVPMPDYMAEQMPEMLPKVMDNLMPHMLPDVIPLIADDMIAYLKNGGNGTAATARAASPRTRRASRAEVRLAASAARQDRRAGREALPASRPARLRRRAPPSLLESGHQRPVHVAIHLHGLSDLDQFVPRQVAGDDDLRAVAVGDQRGR